MCGIIGQLSKSEPLIPKAFYEASKLINHRGPDDEGFLSWQKKQPVLALSGDHTDPKSEHASLPYSPSGSILESQLKPNILLGHKRLSIIDLSPAGHQPMSNRARKVWIIFNGEIYNFSALREELINFGYEFISKTDTEVVLAAYCQWGESFVDRINGMFAFAILDLEKGFLLLARDRFGIKPLYYIASPGSFAFCSEIKPLLSLIPQAREVDEETVYNYLRFEITDQANDTFFKSIKKVPQGHYVKLNIETLRRDEIQYYNFTDRILAKKSSINKLSSPYHLLELLKKSLSEHMVSDVPLAMCLSGGLDSTSLACLLRSINPTSSINTFTTKYENSLLDESQNAQLIAETVGSKHSFLKVLPSQVTNDLEKMVLDQEEPFTKIGIYSQWKLFEKIHEAGFKVSIDGQGADEIFAGYNDYFSDYFEYLKANRKYFKSFTDMIQLLHNQGLEKARFLLKWRERSMKSLAVYETDFVNQLSGTNPFKNRQEQPFDSFNKRLFYSFTEESLPHCLKICDRNAMAHSVESRVPYLDHELVEFGFALSPEQKMGFGTSKLILRKAMKGILPESIRNNQNKVGFWLLLAEWYKSAELRSFVLDLINSRSFRERGFFRQEACLKAFNDFLTTGKTSENFWLWINTELWLRSMVDGKFSGN